jgi:predicted DNA-binding ribbon-helix-helix protein
VRRSRRLILEPPPSPAINASIRCYSEEQTPGLRSRIDMQQDPRTRQILKDNYNKVVEGVARRAYLSANALIRELDESKINPEDILVIKTHIINMLSTIRKSN